MLKEAPRKEDVTRLVVDRYIMRFSLAGEGTKVSMHSLRTLFVSII